MNNQKNKEKYIIPEAAQEWALTTIRDTWRRHRRYLKLNYYDPYDNDEVSMAKKLGHIPDCQFRELLKYWKSEKFKKMSETNTENRKKLMNPHTADKKSFSLGKDKETVSQKDVFVATRTRKPGRLYKALNENTISKIAEMEEIEKEMGADGQPVDVFSAVMGPVHPGRLRLYGAGVTKTSLKKKDGNSAPTLTATNDVVQQMQERMQKMEKQMEEQNRTIRQEVIADVIAQLQHAGLIDPTILAALSVPLLTEGTSAQAADQGDEIEEEECSTEDLT